MLHSLITKLSMGAAFGLLLCAPCLAQSPEPPPLPVGTIAPNFTATDWTGKTIHLSDYRGKIVVVDFWATWCGPCNRAMPDLQDALNKYKNDVVFIALCVWDTSDDANTWIKAHNYTFNFAYDTSGDGTRHSSPTTDAYNVHAIPTTYVIDPKGRIAGGHVVLQEDELLSIIQPLATPKPLSTFATSMATGELGIAGMVTAVGDQTLTISAIGVIDGDKAIDFDTPRPKTIEFTDTTQITNGHSGITQETIAVGSYVNIVGVNDGKKLMAHRIQAY